MTNRYTEYSNGLLEVSRRASGKTVEIAKQRFRDRYKFRAVDREMMDKDLNSGKMIIMQYKDNHASLVDAKPKDLK